MKNRIKKISLFMVIVLLFMVGCSSEKNNQVEEELGSEISVKEVEETIEPVEINLAGGNSGRPNPYLRGMRGPGTQVNFIFDSLLEKGKNGLVPWVAEDYEVSEDGLTYMFIIRDGIKWQDGKDLTAEDVKFSFEYFMEYPPVSDSLRIAGETFIDEIELDDNKVLINVDSKNATYLERIGSTRLIPKHIWEDIEDPYSFIEDEAMIGSGPFFLAKYEEEQGAYRFEAFEEHWLGAPVLSAINYLPVSDNILAFENGEIDITSFKADLMDRYQSNPDYVIESNPAQGGEVLMMNMERRPEFQDKNLRKAIFHAIDREELVEKIHRGSAQVASAGFLAKEHIWYNDEVEGYNFDLDKSRELLDGKTYEFDLVISESHDEPKIAELLQANFEKVGITLNIKSMELKSRDSLARDGDYELLLIRGAGLRADADILREKYASGDVNENTFGKVVGYSNDKINELAEKQMHEMDTEKRKEYIYELQKVISEEVPMITLTNRTAHYVYRPEAYDGWKGVYDNNMIMSNKISYVNYQE